MRHTYGAEGETFCAADGMADIAGLNPAGANTPSRFKSGAAHQDRASDRVRQGERGLRKKTPETRLGSQRICAPYAG